MNDQQRAAMQMALEALESVIPACELFHHTKKEQHLEEEICKPYVRYKNAITALREALAQPQKPDECANGCPERTVCDYCTAQPQGEPVAFLAEATRFKVCMKDHECMITGLPMELGGRWVALVAAEDDCHLRYTTPPSVEAAIEATKEKAIRIVVGWTTCGPMNEWNRTLEKIKQEIAAIRSMK